jgi:hypothetical protein
MTTIPDVEPVQRLRFEGESYVLDKDVSNRHRGVPVVRAETYNALVYELERMRRSAADPTAVYKATSEPRFVPASRRRDT